MVAYSDVKPRIRPIYQQLDWIQHTHIRNDKLVVQDTVGYLPTINTPSTEMSTVNEDPTQTLNTMKTLGLKESVCVFNQVFYVKAAEITWKHDKFKSIILRMVAFHTIPFETSYIDHREEVSGCWPPRLVCVGSGVISEGSITDMMERHKYNRVGMLHKIV